MCRKKDAGVEEINRDKAITLEGADHFTIRDCTFLVDPNADPNEMAINLRGDDEVKIEGNIIFLIDPINTGE